MKKNIVSALIILIVGLSFSCKKTDPPYLIPVITGLSSTNLIAGSTFIINGENLGTDVSQVVATLFDVSGRNSEKLVITSVSNTSITVTIPNKPFTFGTRVYTLQIEIGNSIPQNGANRFQLTIAYPEPTSKWFYVSNFFEGSGGVLKSINFATDSIGYVVLGASLYRTKDGGRNWEAYIQSGSTSFPGYNPLYIFDKNNFWFDDAVYMCVSKNGETVNYYGKKIPDKDGSISLAGTFMSSVNKGQLAATDGRLYYVNGSFSDTLIKEYESRYYSDENSYFATWRKMSNIDEFNLMIAGVSRIGDKYKPIISHKKAGIFTEYDISNVTTSRSINALQLVTPTIAFLVDGNNDLFKLTSGTTWIKLNQKATTIYFKNVNIGYASYDGKILKTTDGGLSWKNECTLEKGETICSITEKNGKLWALGSNKESGVILKYNP